MIFLSFFNVREQLASLAAHLHQHKPDKLMASLGLQIVKCGNEDAKNEPKNFGFEKFVFSSVSRDPNRLDVVAQLFAELLLAGV